MLHRAVPNVMAYSLYSRMLASGRSHFSIVENTMFKTYKGSVWDWWKDNSDRKAMASYLNMRWKIY